MDLRQLRQFVMVADELHFGRAADRLGMTQPPLSQSIKALEAELGVVLFQRTKRSVALTSVGAQWLPYAQELLADAGALPDIAARLFRGEVGSVRLSFVSTADYSVLPLLVSRFKALLPEVDVTLREATSDLQIDALLSGDIDAGLIIPPPGMGNLASLAYQCLRREPLVAAVPEDWIASGRLRSANGVVAFDALKTEPLIVFPRKSAPAFHDLVTAYYAAHGAAPNFGQQAIQMQTIVSLVSVGLGIALAPESMRNLARAGVTYLALEGGAPTIETGLAWRADHGTPAVAQLVEIARQI